MGITSILYTGITSMVYSWLCRRIQSARLSVKRDVKQHESLLNKNSNNNKICVHAIKDLYSKAFQILDVI